MLSTTPKVSDERNIILITIQITVLNVVHDKILSGSKSWMVIPDIEKIFDKKLEILNTHLAKLNQTVEDLKKPNVYTDLELSYLIEYAILQVSNFEKVVRETITSFTLIGEIDKKILKKWFKRYPDKYALSMLREVVVNTLLVDSNIGLKTSRTLVWLCSTKDYYYYPHLFNSGGAIDIINYAPLILKNITTLDEAKAVFAELYSDDTTTCSIGYHKVLSLWTYFFDQYEIVDNQQMPFYNNVLKQMITEVENEWIEINESPDFQKNFDELGEPFNISSINDFINYHELLSNKFLNLIVSKLCDEPEEMYFFDHSIVDFIVANPHVLHIEVASKVVKKFIQNIRLVDYRQSAIATVFENSHLFSAELLSELESKT